MNSPAPSTPTVSGISVKLPTFWQQDPLLWFSQAEAQFDLAKITASTTKYNHVLSILPPDVGLQVRDIILQSSASTEPYSDLKTALIQRNSISDREKLKQLIAKEELGDRKPTVMLRDMHRLLGSTVSTIDKELFKQLFLQKLPTTVQSVLATLKTTTPVDELAATADQVIEIRGSSLQLNQCSVNATSTPSAPSEIELLTRKIDQIFQLFSKDITRHSSRNRNRSESTPRYKHRQRSSSQNNKEDICYYHRRFRKDAKKCQQPCKFHKQGNYAGEM